MITKDFKNTRGITLIALIVSIIVLLILLGISISVIVGENGVLTQAKSSIKKNKQATVLEEMTMAWGSLKTDYYAKWAQNSGVNFSNIASEILLQRYLEEKGTVNNIENNQDGTYVIDYTANDKEESRYLFLAKENGTVEFLDGIVLTPGNMKLELLVNGVGEATSTSRTIKANLTNIEGQVNWTILEGSDVIELSSTSGEIITITSKFSEEFSSIQEKEAKIKATCGDYSAICNVTVKRKTPIERIDGILAEKTTINVDEVLTLTANIYPENATENNLIWESSNSDVVTVPEIGPKSITILGLNIGITTITVKNQAGISKSINITVENPVIVTYIVDNNTYATKEITKGETVTDWPENPSKSGCAFVGWFDSTTEGTEFTNLTQINEDVVLYARFYMTLILDSNGGSFEDGSSTKTITGIYGQEIEFPKVKKDKYILNGWRTLTNGGTQIYNGGIKNTLIKGGTLYARWDCISTFLGEPLNENKYGYIVEGYNSQDYDGDWRLFYQDNVNTYIIADSTSYQYSPNNYYKYYDNTLRTYVYKYTNTSNISMAGRNLNSLLKIGTNSCNDMNIRSLGWMTDTASNSSWSKKYKDSGEDAIADFAIGSPSLELFASSYKATHPEKIITLRCYYKRAFILQ